MNTNGHKYCEECNWWHQVEQVKRETASEVLNTTISRAVVGLEALPESAAPYWIGYWTGMKTFAQELKQKWGGE